MVFNVLFLYVFMVLHADVNVGQQVFWVPFLDELTYKDNQNK